MKRKQLESSVIKSVGYNPGKKVLEVEFTSKVVYHYLDVPDTVFEELINASSHGAYFNANVKDEYKWLKIRN